MRMNLEAHSGTVHDLNGMRPDGGCLQIAWLGQAGFLIQSEYNRILIDPYLSDSLAVKYQGAHFDHQRMVPVPIAPDELSGINLVLCTHRHTDHMDPETLAGILNVNPGVRFVLPMAELDRALGMGLPRDQLIGVDAGQADLELSEGVCLEAVLPAAHEKIELDDEERHRFLGYLLNIEGVRIYHSGDTVVFPELVERLRTQHVDLALLPVNGRDARRRSHGVPGNMSLEEAIELCRTTGMRRLLPHHFGMFTFNTVDVSRIVEAAGSVSDIEICVPAPDKYFILSMKNN